MQPLKQLEHLDAYLSTGLRGELATSTFRLVVRQWLAKSIRDDAVELMQFATRHELWEVLELVISNQLKHL